MPPTKCVVFVQDGEHIDAAAIAPLLGPQTRGASETGRQRAGVAFGGTQP